MNETDTAIQSLLERAMARERAARWRAVLLTVIPAIFALALIWYSANLVKEMTAELASKQKELNKAIAALSSTQSQVEASQQDLKKVQDGLNLTSQELEKARTELKLAQAQTTETQRQLEDLRKKYESLQRDYAAARKEYDALINSMREVRGQAYTGDTLTALKYLYDRYPAQAEMLNEMLYRYQGSPWKLGGLSPEEGFDSPSFAAFILERMGKLPRPAAEARYELQAIFRPPPRPAIGDLAFYELGYTMFYYEDEQGNPFVVGMTPLGVLALKPDFARLIRYGDVPYP